MGFSCTCRRRVTEKYKIYNSGGSSRRLYHQTFHFHLALSIPQPKFSGRNRQTLPKPSELFGTVYVKNLLSMYVDEDEDEQSKRFETHNFNYTFRHLKTIKIIYFHGAPSENESILPLKKYLLRIATVLEKFIIVLRLGRSNASQDYVKMKQEL